MEVLFVILSIIPALLFVVFVVLSWIITKMKKDITYIIQRWMSSVMQKKSVIGDLVLCVILANIIVV